MPPAALPARPSPKRLIRLAVSEHAARLREEWRQSGAPLFTTLGEEAREVAVQLANHCEGPPSGQLRSYDDAYGQPGTIDLAGRSAKWLTLTHPGNTLRSWQPARQRWTSWARSCG